MCPRGVSGESPGRRGWATPMAMAIVSPVVMEEEKPAPHMAAFAVRDVILLGDGASPSAGPI